MLNQLELFVSLAVVLGIVGCVYLLACACGILFGWDEEDKL